MTRRGGNKETVWISHRINQRKETNQINRTQLKLSKRKMLKIKLLYFVKSETKNHWTRIRTTSLNIIIQHKMFYAEMIHLMFLKLKLVKLRFRLNTEVSFISSSETHLCLVTVVCSGTVGFCICSAFRCCFFVLWCIQVCVLDLSGAFRYCWFLSL